MKDRLQLKDFLKNGHRIYRPNLSIDCAIFGYLDGELQILLVKNKILTKWCLPGGYVEKTETLDTAAARITMERTGIRNLFLRQFKAFGNPGRNKVFPFDEKNFFEITGVEASALKWLTGDTVTIGFYAISDVIQSKPEADILSSECAWFPVENLPILGFDHLEIIQEALTTMRMQLYHFPIGKNLLPKKFTLKEIKIFYEAMSGKKLNPTNFPNKLIALGLIKKTSTKKHIGPHRAPTFYTFDDKKYQRALLDGLVLV